MQVCYPNVPVRYEWSKIAEKSSWCVGDAAGRALAPELPLHTLQAHIPDKQDEMALAWKTSRPVKEARLRSSGHCARVSWRTRLFLGLVGGGFITWWERPHGDPSEGQRLTTWTSARKGPQRTKPVMTHSEFQPNTLRSYIERPSHIREQRRKKRGFRI